MEHTKLSCMRTGPYQESALSKHLEGLGAKKLLEIFQCSVMPNEDGTVPDFVRLSTGDYWNNIDGLCISYVPGLKNYRIYHIQLDDNGAFTPTISACPTDAKLSTLLHLLRDAEHQHQCALANQKAPLPVAPKLGALPCQVEASSNGYLIAVGEFKEHCPTPELIPLLAEQLAERYLQALSQALGLSSEWSLAFDELGSIAARHEDCKELHASIPWAPTINRCAELAKESIEAAHASLLQRWLPKWAGQHDYIGRAPDGCALIRWTILKDTNGNPSWSYEQKVPFRQKRIEELGRNQWQQIADDLNAELRKHKSSIIKCCGEFVDPVLVFIPEHGNLLGSEATPHLHRFFCESARSKKLPACTELVELCKELKFWPTSLADLEKLCLHFVVEGIKRQASPASTAGLPGLGQLQVEGSIAEGYTLRIGLRTKALTLASSVHIKSLADCEAWLDYKELCEAQNKENLVTLQRHQAPGNILSLDLDSDYQGQVRWTLHRTGDMDDVGLWVRRRDLYQEYGPTIAPLTWGSAVCRHQAAVAIAKTLAQGSCLLGGPIELDLDKLLCKYGVDIRVADASYKLKAKSLIGRKTYSAKASILSNELWMRLVDIQLDRYEEVEKYWWKHMRGKLRSFSVLAAREGHFEAACHQSQCQIRPKIDASGALWISAWSGHYDDCYYREFAVQSLTELDAVRKAVDWCHDRDPLRKGEKIKWDRWSPERYPYDKTGQPERWICPYDEFRYHLRYRW